MMRFLVSIYLFCCLTVPAWALQNQLRDHASPYLAMHADDPVAWQDWGEAALAKARKEDKLLFVSSGYFSCHWCHVMQKESYQNPAIAQWLNEHYIPVKIDRELHPALDEYLIDYMERTQGHAGWPLNVFLTPEGYPLIGATYMPTQQFSQLLSKLSETWQAQRSKTRNIARRALLEVLAQKAIPIAEPIPHDELRSRLIEQALSVSDAMEGGFGQENKFPMSPQLLAILEVRGEKPNEALDSWLQTTLDQMARQGLRDQLAGGFYRYTVDPSWHIPHYEKMLYTQAQLARIYLLAGKRYQRKDYLAVARDTLGFTLRDMQGKQGALIASFSAIDGTGIEGGTYLWQTEELRKLLTEEEYALAAPYWNLQGTPPTEGGYLPRLGETAASLAQKMKLDVQEVEQRLQSIRAKLLAARVANRTLPADNKELAAWNGLMISALVLAAKQLDEPKYLKAAQQIRDSIRAKLWQGNGDLWRARHAGQAVGVTSLADYAYLAEGMHHLAAFTKGTDDIAWRDELIQQAWQRFFVERGWLDTEQALIPGMGEKAAQADGALLSPAGVLLRISLKQEALQDKVKIALALSRFHAQQEPFWYPGHLLALLEGNP
jgi:uncharacterized protein YyaL (SSP411 family)